jgi:hypothetical protein
MSFFTTLSASLLSTAAEATNSEGVDIYEIKAVNLPASGEAIPILLQVDQESTQGRWLKEAAAMTKDGKAMRVLVSGILQQQLALKNDETKEITKPPKLVVYVGAARRLQADTKKDPEQSIVFGSGFARPSFDFEDKRKRKPEIFVSTGNESLTEPGTYASSLQLLGESEQKTDVKCLDVEDGREVYFMANLFRIKGQMGDIQYDKLKASATFIEESDRVRSRKSNGRPKPVSMNSQLNDSFEESDSSAQVMSSDELVKQAAISLADF